MRKIFGFIARRTHVKKSDPLAVKQCQRHSKPQWNLNKQLDVSKNYIVSLFTVSLTVKKWKKKKESVKSLHVGMMTEEIIYPSAFPNDLYSAFRFCEK